MSEVALVTGGAKRVGRAVCFELAKRGYRVAVHANTSMDAAQSLVKEIESGGGEAKAFQANLTDEAASRAMIDSVHQHFGRIDVLVNSAAIWSPVPFAEITADEVRKNFEINAVATFICAQQAGLIMAGQESGGVIINFGDAAAAQPQAGYAAYHPSKGAIPAMTRSLAVELSQQTGPGKGKIRVNAVLPGPVLISEAEPEERKKQIARGTLLDQIGHADHLVHAVAFLVENSFVTGVCLPVEGGRSLADGWESE